MGSSTTEKKPVVKTTPHHPEPEQLPCPRCSSTNTKFCYYNNYNFSQPRHFCKSCRRYWTHGGTLRDIPVGGSSRKSGKRLRASEMVSPDFRRLPPPPPPPERSPFMAEGKVCGSFTSLLNSTAAVTHGAGILALGGFSLDEASFGIGRGVWPTYGILDGAPAGGASAATHTWHFDNGGDAGGFMGGGDYLAFPDLAISTPASLLK